MAKPTPTIIRWAAGLAGAGLLGLGAAIAWRAKSPTLIVVAGLVLVLAALFGDRVTRVGVKHGATEAEIELDHAAADTVLKLAAAAQLLPDVASSTEETVPGPPDEAMRIAAVKAVLAGAEQTTRDLADALAAENRPDWTRTPLSQPRTGRLAQGTYQATAFHAISDIAVAVFIVFPHRAPEDVHLRVTPRGSDRVVYEQTMPVEGRGFTNGVTIPLPAAGDYTVMWSERRSAPVIAPGQPPVEHLVASDVFTIGS